MTYGLSHSKTAGKTGSTTQGIRYFSNAVATAWMISAFASIPTVNSSFGARTRLYAIGRDILNNRLNLLPDKVGRNVVDIADPCCILTGQCGNDAHSVHLPISTSILARTLCAANVFRSACIPAPPDGSEPAIDKTDGGAEVSRIVDVDLRESKFVAANRPTARVLIRRCGQSAKMISAWTHHCVCHYFS
jgi:hypothetical protein